MSLKSWASTGLFRIGEPDSTFCFVDERLAACAKNANLGEIRHRKLFQALTVCAQGAPHHAPQLRISVLYMIVPPSASPRLRGED